MKVFRISAVLAAASAALCAAPLGAQDASHILAVETTATPGMTPSAATAADDAATSPGAEGQLFGKPFSLLADVTDLEIVEGEVTDLDARENVLLEMEDIVIQSGRLIFSNKTQMMQGFRDSEKQCKLVRPTSTTYCDTFTYNLETGDVAPRGKVKTELRGKQNVEITSRTQTFDQDAETGKNSARFEGDVRIRTKGFVPKSKYDSDEGILIVGEDRISDSPQ